jgi:hypothetical protein
MIVINDRRLSANSAPNPVRTNRSDTLMTGETDATVGQSGRCEMNG